MNAMVLTPMGLRFQGRVIPCTRGRNGITTRKREGDGATPAGQWHIVGMLYRPDRIVGAHLPGWARPIGPRDLWCDDPAHPDYNHAVRAPLAASHERLRRADPLYDLILVTDWNYPEGIPYLGSAIFLHRWRRPGYPTAGCLAMAPGDLHWIATRVLPGTPVIVPG